MPSSSRRLLSFFVAYSGVYVLGMSCALAQEYPTRPISFIVANPTGTPTDLLARTLAQEVSKAVGQPIIVENKPGANQVIAFEYVAKQAPADGYTWAMVYTTALVTLPLLVKDLRFDPLKDLTPIIGLAEDRLALWTSAKSPWKTFGELVKHAKANPGKLNYGYPSSGIRLTTEALIRSPDLGLSIVNVPYKGSAPYYQAITSGEVHMGLGAVQVAVSQGDMVRILAVTGNTRMQAYPDVPTFTQLGYPYIRGVSYIMSARTGTPKSVIGKVHDAVARTLQQPATRTRLSSLGVEIMGDSSAESASKNQADEARLYAEIAKRIGIQPE